MLDNLFGSKARVKLLKLFLLHPQDKYYTREIARYLGLQLNSVHRELTNLEEIGLIVSSASDSEEGADGAEKKATKAKDKKYYQANIDFVFFKELKALIVKAQILYERDFTSNLKKVGKIDLLILTGLFVNKLDSDIDLFLVGTFDKSKLAKVVKDLERELVKEINYTVMTKEEFRYRREIADIFLYNILDSNKIVVIDENQEL